MPEIVNIDINDKGYPEKLKMIFGSKAPALYLQGNTELLNTHSIGFCGSRNSSPKGKDAVRDCASQAAKNNIIIVSGNASGIDFEAHYNALFSGGATILVLPEGINHFRIKKALKPVWDWNRCLVISQFLPDDTWKIYRAMTRNKLIIALSGAMIVIEAGEKGGTMNAGLETLKTNVPLYVAEYQDMSEIAKGNKKLLDMGAKRIAKNRQTGKANMNHLYHDIFDPPTSTSSEQLVFL